MITDSMIIKESRYNRGIVWDNYKAGVINLDDNRIIIPIRFDEIYWRIQTFKSPGPKLAPNPPEFIGFACFNDDGEAVAYDADGNIDEWRDWEQPVIEYDEMPQRTVESIEQEVAARYDAGEDRCKLSDLLYDRRKLLNHNWRHTPENVAKISRVNDMLNSAVREALSMGEAMEKTLTGEWMMTVEVYPEWEQGDFRNTIAELGLTRGIEGYSPCFTMWCADDKPGEWDFKYATMDDGVSWDEGGYHRPAYMYCFFYMPFQSLSLDNYILAHSDIADIKRFDVRMLVKKVAKQRAILQIK